MLELLESLFIIPVISVECKYEIFKKLALEKLNYRVILPGDIIVTPSNVGLYN